VGRSLTGFPLITPTDKASQDVGKENGKTLADGRGRVADVGSRMTSGNKKESVFHRITSQPPKLPQEVKDDLPHTLS